MVVHRVIGRPDAQDVNRWQTICRARNRGKGLGNSAWVMFLDDDVVLARDCIATLLRELEGRTAFGAIASNYLNEPLGVSQPPHVGMGATLFRRSALDRVRFRWTTQRCECQCCCDDLRRQRLGITYSAKARSRHLAKHVHWHATAGGPPDSAARTDQQASRQQPSFEVALFGPISRPRAEKAETPSVREERRVKRDASVGPCLLESNSRPKTCAAWLTLRVPINRETSKQPGRVLTAFDRHHFGTFCDQFLTSLRAYGNRERVTVVGYGLTVRQQQTLAGLEAVDYIPRPAADAPPARRRLDDFQAAIAPLEPSTPVAYWDAGDAFFQGRLSPLWHQVQAHPGKLLMCREAVGHPQNPTIHYWTRTIRNPQARHDVFALLCQRPWLNGGFAAATVHTMARSLNAASKLRSSTLVGTANRGDQTALNYYCHTHPDAWLELDCRWNYCLCKRKREEFRVRRDGLFVTANGDRIHVVHGNANTLPAVPGYGRARQRIRQEFNRRWRRERVPVVSVAD